MRNKVHAGLILSLAVCLSVCLLINSPAAFARKEKKKKEKDPFAAATGWILPLSTSQEKKMGQEVKGEVLKQYKLYDNADLVSYVRRIGAKVAAYADRQDVEYEFFVLDDPLVNAFALPGGAIYITRGILTVFDDESELAGVLGHEISHIVEKHSMKHYMSATVMDLGWRVFGKGQDLPLGYQIGADLLLFKPYGRADELKSDALGLKYSYMAGYQADRVAKVFEEFRKREKFKMPEFLRSHPVDDRRIEQIRELWGVLQTRSDIKPGAQPLVTNTDAYAQAVFPHTYRVHFPAVQAAFESLLAAVGRKDIGGVMDVVHKKFKSDWLKMDKEKYRKFYEERFAAVDRISDTAVFSEFRVLDKDAISALCTVSESRTYPDGRSESDSITGVTFFVKHDEKDTGGAPGVPWRLIGIEDGGKW